jgi:arabinofuranosyltransferase
MIEDRISRVHARRLVTFAAALVFLVVLVRTAWVNDDAYVSFRTVDNVLHGYGLRWNVINRVQTYTHPLWLLVMTAAAAVTGDVYYTSIGLSIALSLVVVVAICWRLAPSPSAGLLACSALILSKSFVEYSTSGLENALTHLLLIAFLLMWLAPSAAAPVRRRVLRLTLIASLLMLNRLDTGLLVLPAIGAAVWESGIKRTWPALALGLVPLLAWELFAIVYYGFPFPNTAYAKLATGVPRGDVLYQGSLYILDAVSHDPLTILVVVAAVASPLLLKARRPLPAGIAIYVAYVVWAGGDFMSGRFLSAPFLCSVVHLMPEEAPDFGVLWKGAMAVVCLIGFVPGWPPNFSDNSYGGDIDPSNAIRGTHVNDERRYYYAGTGLLTTRRGVMMPNHKWLQLGYEARKDGERVHRTDAAGFVGYGAGPGVYVLDRWAIGDPLLARLPAEVPWEVGHYPRRIPDGYVETLETGRNRIRDFGVAAFYERLRVIIEGPIWSTHRFRTIAAMNLGRYDSYIAQYGIVRVRLDEVAAPKANGTQWDETGNVVMTLRGVAIAVSDSADAVGVELSLSRNDTYAVTFLRGDRKVGAVRIVQPATPDGSLLTHVVSGPSSAFDTILVQPSSGDSRYSLGHLRLIPKPPPGR